MPYLTTGVQDAGGDSLMAAEIIDLVPRLLAHIRVREETGWQCVLLRDDVSIGQLMHALRLTDLCLSNDPTTGVATIHRKPVPDGAA